MASAIRQNYREDTEAAINRYINLELHASYVFLSMSYHFDRDDTALPGLSKFFKGHSDFNNVNAQKLMKYQNQRGGRVVLQDIPPPPKQEWGQGLEAIMTALDLKKQLHKGLLDLCEGISEEDTHALDFLNGNFLGEQIETIRKLGDMVTKHQRVEGNNIGLSMLDRDLL
ncbi:ferritin, heavy subunit [Procambarus clarkii]|uniref:ferritin, heavy subunit n=1 Tax=Procambarus clarkii TaxID=6728 RepID=UPI001E671178|nr:ferritin, heavy subunit-like [Procambarus clarkii]